jgi:protein tyrosine phosphatase (PTP) superfamily phosphohydrolase (DUF442 family)
MHRWILGTAAAASGAVRAALGLPPRWRRSIRLLAAALAVVALLLATRVWYITLGGNFHTVVPGDVYRAGQPSAARLRALARSHHVRTVINLRGDNNDGWYYEEHATAREVGMRVVDVGLWAKQPPPDDQFRLLVETLAEAEPAVLVHCNSGGDRSGLAAALAILLRTDGTLDEARRQLSLYYGHNCFGQAACHDRVLDRYKAWLADKGWQHRPERLRLWARTVYTAQE